MNRKGILALAILLVLVLAGATWAYLEYRSAPEVQAPITDDRDEVLSKLKTDWSRLEQGPLKHSAESGHWFLDAVEFLGPNRVLVHFEDGLYDEYALLSESNGIFTVEQRFQNRNEFQGLRAASSYMSPVYQYDPDRGTFTVNPEYKVFEPAPVAGEKMEIKIAWLDPSGTLPNEVKLGDISGCDHVVLVERMVPKTQATLTAALTELLNDKTNTSPGDDFYNYIGLGNLSLDSVSIVSGVAKIYLTGTAPAIAGVCDEPRLFIQVAQTARQFSTVQSVEVYVNGNKIAF